MTKLDQLHLEKSKKFADICALVACELGYGELATIKSEARHHVEREAERRITEWEDSLDSVRNMDREPDRRRLGPCPRHAVPTVGRQQHPATFL
jgi:hypothetical protein